MTTRNNIKLTPETYVMRFGKFKDQKAVDIAKIYTVDKDGNSVAKGLMYLEWTCKQDWFKHSDIQQKIIDNAKQNMSEESKPAKLEPKKKEKKQTVKISSDETEKTTEF